LDVVRDTLVVFGGYGNRTIKILGGEMGGGSVVGSTWEWDGNWTLRFDESGTPVGRDAHGMAWDPNRKRVVIYGGVSGFPGGSYFMSDMWEWDGVSWSPIPLSPNPVGGREQHRMLTDPLRSRVVLFGGRWLGDRSITEDVHSVLDTWEWNGSEWNDVTPDVLPGEISFPVYDSVRKRIVMAGTGWEWDGSTWRNPGWMDPVGFIGASFDDATGQYVGYETGVTSVLQSDPDLRPGLHLTLDWGSARVQEADIREIRVRATAGGRGYSLDVDPSDEGDLLGEAIDGAELLAWNARTGEWRLLGSNAAAPDLPAALESVSLDPGFPAPDLLVQRDGKMHFMVRSKGGLGNGPATPEVTVDTIEILIGYRWCGPEDCDGRECGTDACGNPCGTCAGPLARCENGICTCTPSCEGMECGDDGCGGSCGACAEGLECASGSCVPPACGGISFKFGCCHGNTFRTCLPDGTVLDVDCNEHPFCGWNDWGGYRCGTAGGEDPTGRHPRECPTP
jgi:hypothetical protein